MRARPSIIGLTTKIFDLDSAQITGTNLITSDVYDIPVGSTDSPINVPLRTLRYTIDTQATISVIDMYLDIFTNNSANAMANVQISGNGGNTFVDAINNIGAGILRTSGPGLWITSIETGVDKLQIRILGRSTNGLPATINLLHIIGFQPMGLLVIRKT